MSILQAPPRHPYGHVPDNNLDSDDNAVDNADMSLYSDNETTLAATTAATTPAKAKTTGGKHARDNLDRGQSPLLTDEAAEEVIRGNSEAFNKIKKSFSFKKTGKKEVDAI